jgi:hypothetical protein
MSKIHPVFHISLLEPAPKHALIAENVEIDDDTEQEYEVEQISENTWEPIENLTNCAALIRQYSKNRKANDPSHQPPDSN